MTEPRTISLQAALAALREKIQVGEAETDGVTCHWCHQACGGTCLSVTESKQMDPSDPAYWMLKDGRTTVAKVYDATCYICRDPEYGMMGLPLCKPCPSCTAKAGTEAGHVPADDIECTVCGASDEYEEYVKSQEKS